MDILTKEQQDLVSQSLALVDIVIHRYITVRPDIPGMEYDDLHQVGSLALCKAAARFDGRCKFSTFASTVVKNDLIDYCRGNCCTPCAKPLDALAGEGELQASEEYSGILSVSDNADAELRSEELAKALQRAKAGCSGCTLRGIESLELKIKGYSGAEIAQLYGVKNNLVTAWISRAAARLRSDPQFLSVFQ